MNKFTSRSPEETQGIAREWVKSLDTSSEGAQVIGLYGNLGSGKTTFTQAVAKEMGVEDIVNSPTYVIEKIYETKHPHFIRLIHIDAYRLEKGRDLQDLNFEELVNNKHNLIMIEWPENVKEILPQNTKRIELSFVDENIREIKVQ
ncbi:MAG: tRNA (adenosine(37)-N6)-threonylcarbamoyltransferase complex ATPase subunit type 1 TsaE [bacterium]|nr:tRNA (adenosine(37)-N6)-threonylcarbamoyltransferase complex ATPase subunit type 1 TsaE [bacterium]